MLGKASENGLTNNDRIQNIKQRHAEATPGPWMWEDDNRLIPVNPLPDDVFGFVAEGAIDAENGETFIDIDDQDALFVATAHEDMSYLLSEYEAMKNAIEIAYAFLSNEKAMSAEDALEQILSHLKG